MRRLIPVLAAVLLAALLAFVWLDGPARLAAEAAAAQRAAQNAMAGALRAIRAGQPGALAALLALAFGYGVAHAAGPGHGKLVVGAYGIAARVRLGRLAAVALLASLAQATTAVVLVYAGVLLFDLTREQLGALADRWLMQASAVAIGAIGLWLVLRGGRRLAAAAGPVAVQGHAQGHHHRDHHHGHHHGPLHGPLHGPACDHVHLPDPGAIDRARHPRELAALIAAVAIRPCTGALFLLVLTWRMGIGGAGIAGAYAMGLGTAVITVAAAVAAVTLRDGTLAALARGGGNLSRLLPLAEIAAGLAVALLAAAMLAPG